MLWLERMQVSLVGMLPRAGNTQPQVGWAQGERHRGDPSLMAWVCPISDILR